MMKVDSSSISFIQKPANEIAQQRGRSQSEEDSCSSRSGDSRSPPSQLNIEKELQRLQSLRSYHVLEADYDALPCKRLATLAARYFQAPLANVVLVDLERCWSLTSTPEETSENGRETKRWGSIYDEACKDPAMFFCVNDLETDINLQKMKNKSQLDDYRFFASTPLVTYDGHRIGVLSVMDFEPRTAPSIDDVMFLKDIASSMMDLLEQRRSLLREGVNQSSAGLLRSARFVRECIRTVQEDEEFRTVIAEHEENLITTAGMNADVMCTAFAAPGAIDKKHSTQKKLVNENICGPSRKKTGMC